MVNREPVKGVTLEISYRLLLLLLLLLHLYRTYTYVYLKQNTFQGHIILLLFCGYSIRWFEWYLPTKNCCTFTSVLFEVLVQCPELLFPVFP
jgi:hypothetical protein